MWRNLCSLLNGSSRSCSFGRNELKNSSGWSVSFNWSHENSNSRVSWSFRWITNSWFQSFAISSSSSGIDCMRWAFALNFCSDGSKEISSSEECLHPPRVSFSYHIFRRLRNLSKSDLIGKFGVLWINKCMCISFVILTCNERFIVQNHSISSRKVHLALLFCLCLTWNYNILSSIDAVLSSSDCLDFSAVLCDQFV